jgi:hypothetical protein
LTEAWSATSPCKKIAWPPAALIFSTTYQEKSGYQHLSRKTRSEKERQGEKERSRESALVRVESEERYRLSFLGISPRNGYTPALRCQQFGGLFPNSLCAAGDETNARHDRYLKTEDDRCWKMSSSKRRSWPFLYASSPSYISQVLIHYLDQENEIFATSSTRALVDSPHPHPHPLPLPHPLPHPLPRPLPHRSIITSEKPRPLHLVFVTSTVNAPLGFASHVVLRTAEALKLRFNAASRPPGVPELPKAQTKVRKGVYELLDQQTFVARAEVLISSSMRSLPATWKALQLRRRNCRKSSARLPD